MGSSVSKITKPVSSLVGGTLGIATGGMFGAKAVNAGKAFVPDKKVFQQSKAQEAFQARLLAQSLGEGPSTAQQQLKTATDRTLAQQIAMAASTRGNQALAQREAMRNQGAATQEAGAAAANLRAQEMQAAMQAYGDDLERQQTLKVQEQQMKGGSFDLTQGRAFDARKASAANDAALMGGIISGGAQVGAAKATSDKNSKDHIKTQDLAGLVEKIKAYEFEYKTPNGEPYQDGKVVGVMAQDLEKSKLGKSLVSDTPTGKVVDLKKAVPLALASIGELAKKIKELEKRKG